MNKKKIYIIVSACLLCIMALVGTVAYYSKVLFTDLTVDTIVHDLDYFINYTEGQNISAAELTSSADYTGGVNTSVELWKKDDTYDIYGHIYLDINEIGVNASNASALKYAVVNNGSLIDSGSLRGTASGNSIVLAGNIPLSTTKQLYTVYIWIDQNLIIDESMENEALSLTIRCEATMKEISILKGASLYITNLYNNAAKTTVTNNSITYNYATSVSLMNDRLGGTTTDLDAGNIRYYGASPNNYVYFNCDDYSNQSADTCELWRIIGVFDGKVKIIRNDLLEYGAWDYDYNNDGVSTTRTNDWVNASLNTLLNGAYYNNVDTVYYSYDYDNQKTLTYTLQFNTKNIGIKNDATRDMILESYWNLGGSFHSNTVYSDQIYRKERGTNVISGRPTSWTGKIALAYPSDYGYAGDFNYCTNVLFLYYDYNAYAAGENPSTACRDNDWMNIGDRYWFLTPSSSNSEYVWGVSIKGYVASYFEVGSRYALRPVLYLNSEATIESGDGTVGNPYRLSVR